MDAVIIFVPVPLHLLAALGTALQLGRPLLDGVGLPLQSLVEPLLGEHLANGLDGVLDGAEFGPPSGTIGAVEALDQALGHAFEVGANRICRRGGNGEPSHPWLLSRMRWYGKPGGDKIPQTAGVEQTHLVTIIAAASPVNLGKPRRK